MTAEWIAQEIERYRPVLLGLADTYVWQREHREDTVQRALAAAWTKRQGFTGDCTEQFQGWVWRIFLNEVRALGRSPERAEVQLPVKLDVKDARGEDRTEEQLQEVMEIIARMPPAMRAGAMSFLEPGDGPMDRTLRHRREEAINMIRKEMGISVRV